MELLYMVGWDIKRGSLCGKQYSKVMYEPAIPYHIYPYITKRTENRYSKKYLDTNNSYTIHNFQKADTTQVSIMNKLWYIHTKEYYSAPKRNEVLIHVTMWMKL